jgi:hypothetical protein
MTFADDNYGPRFRPLLAADDAVLTVSCLANEVADVLAALAARIWSIRRLGPKLRHACAP